MANSAPFLVKIKKAPKGAWYQFLIGQTFSVIATKAVFKGHVYKYNMYEVQDFAFEGDMIWPDDCEVCK